jgi:hypothetical protein
LLQVWRASGTLSTVYPQDSPRATARESVMDRRAGPARQNWPATKAVAQLRSEHFEGQSSASRMFRCRGCDGGRQSGTAGGARALTTLRSLRRQPVCNRESGTLFCFGQSPRCNLCWPGRHCHAKMHYYGKCHALHAFFVGAADVTRLLGISKLKDKGGWMGPGRTQTWKARMGSAFTGQQDR